MSSSKPIFGHHSEMKITSILLFFLVPAFIFMFGSIVGEDYAAVVKYFSTLACYNHFTHYRHRPATFSVRCPGSN